MIAGEIIACRYVKLACQRHVRDLANTTQVVTPTRAGTFMVKAIDALGQESDAWVEAILLPQITRVEVIVEVPSRSIRGDDAVLDDTGHLTVTYARDFLETPSVQLTARQSLAPGGNIVLVDSDAHHFKVEHRDAAGAPTAGGSIDYFVQGYGGYS